MLGERHPRPARRFRQLVRPGRQDQHLRRYLQGRRGERRHSCITREENDLFLAELAARGGYLDDAEEPEPAAASAVTTPEGAAGAASFTISNDGNADLVIGYALARRRHLVDRLVARGRPSP